MVEDLAIDYGNVDVAGLGNDLIYIIILQYNDNDLDDEDNDFDADDGVDGRLWQQCRS